MNQRSDIDRLLRHWMDDGPTRMPDRIVDVVADRISVQRQRRSWRLLRRLPMNPIFKLGAAAAAVLVVAFVGWNLLPGGSGPGGAPSPSPSPSRPIDLPEGLLTGGRYLLHPFTSVPTLSVAADVPTGWYGGPPWAVVGPTTEEPPDGILLGFLAADGLFSDPCHWNVEGTGASGQPGDVEVGPTVADLVEALQANTSYTSSTPSPVTFGPYLGQRFEIQLPSDLELPTCDKEAGSSRYFVFAGKDAGVYAQGNGTDRDRWDLSIVDVEGTRVIIAILYYEATSEADREAAQAIIDSLEFTP